MHQSGINFTLITVFSKTEFWVPTDFYPRWALPAWQRRKYFSCTWDTPGAGRKSAQKWCRRPEEGWPGHPSLPSKMIPTLDGFNCGLSSSMQRSPTKWKWAETTCICNMFNKCIYLQSMFWRRQKDHLPRGLAALEGKDSECLLAHLSGR